VSRRLLIVLATLVVVVLVGAAVFVRVTGDDGSNDSALGETVAGLDPPEPPPPTTTTTEQERDGFLAAHAGVPQVALFDSPDASEPVFFLPNPTHEGMPLAFLVREEQGSRFRVALPMRPNGSEGWIDKADVFTNEVPNRIEVEVGAHRLTVYEGRTDQVLMQTSVAVGTSSTPTPLGNFYVDISVAQNTYTPWILSVAGFSDQLQSFGGGIGQIAIHGWSDTSVLGQNVSNGCVRVSFDDLWRLRDLAPVGTPVDIVA
jgi:lipoprotein-anchoring transpeptidase ErfK/SrfK